MSTRKAKLLALGGVLCSMLLPTTSRAMPDIAIAAEASTQGLGLQATMEVIPYVNVRALTQGFGFGADATKDGIVYDGYARLFTGGLLADIYPLVWGPRLSLGVMGNANRVYVRAQCQDSRGCNVQDVNISNSQDAHLDGEVRFNGAAPYAGFGWGNPMLGIPFYVSIDAGVLFQGRPKVSLHASGTATVTDLRALVVRPNDNLATDPQVQAAVVQEQGVLASDIKNFQFYPVISLTMGYRF